MQHLAQPISFVCTGWTGKAVYWRHVNGVNGGVTLGRLSGMVLHIKLNVDKASMHEEIMRLSAMT